jgi:dienelactone hydrolase
MKKFLEASISFVSALSATALLVGGLAGSSQAAVKELSLKASNGLNLETLVLYPDTPSTTPLAVVLADHGFLLNQKFYKGLLSQVADQGFVVVAPQAYAPGGLPFGKPSTQVEAQNVAKAFNWYSTNLSALIKQPLDFSNVGLLNHSRGGKVAFILIKDKLVKAKAFAAVDPVDGTMDGSPRVTDTAAKINVPSLIVGTGLGSQKKLGQACAPTDVNFEHFWSSVQSDNSWLLVAKDYGHMDHLDSGINCGLICNACVGASSDLSRDDYRNWLAANVGSFFKGILYRDSSALDTIGSSSVAGLNFTVETK